MWLGFVYIRGVGVREAMATAARDSRMELSLELSRVAIDVLEDLIPLLLTL